MTLADTLKRLTAVFEGGPLDAPRPPVYPGVAVEIAPDRVTGVRVGAERKGGRMHLEAVETRPLPEGAIEPSLARPNVLAPEPVTMALQDVLGRLAPGGHRISMLIPDQVARVALLAFAVLPRTRRELLELTRFRMGKSLPFKAEDAVVDLLALNAGGVPSALPGAASVLAAFVHRAVVEQYESLVTSSGYWPGLVGLSSLELYNLFRDRLEGQAGSDRDLLFLNATNHDLTVLIFRGQDLIFYRCKAHPAGSSTTDAVRALGREVYTSLAFYQEKLLGRGMGRAFLRCAGVPREAVRDAVAGEAGCPVENVDLLEEVPLATGLVLDESAMEIAAPAVGAILGRRR